LAIKDKIKAEIIEVRGEDVPYFVESLMKEGKEAIGITGEDLFKEFSLNNTNAQIRIAETIPWKDENFIFEKPSLCLLGPKDKNISDMPKKLRICINSKYKEIAKKKCLGILENKGYRIEKIYASGATEEFFSNKLVDLVIDIVCSGKSLEKYNLKIYDKIFESNIVIIKKKESQKQNKEDTEKKFDASKVDFDKLGLIPTIIKDKKGNILTLAYSNKESLTKTLETRQGWYFSRSRNKLWLKGETSGNYQEVLDIKTDCDKDALLFTVKQKGNACHLDRYSCFNEKKKFDLEALYEKIKEKIKDEDNNSYTKKLVSDPELLKRKLIEEAAEVITAKDKGNLIGECSDLIYFLLVIMAKNNVTIEDIEKENLRRDTK